MSKHIAIKDFRDMLVELNSRVWLERGTVIPILESMADLPRIDIVYCVECRYKDMELCPMSRLRKAGVLKLDSFCSFGEREDNE